MDGPASAKWAPAAWSWKAATLAPCLSRCRPQDFPRRRSRHSRTAPSGSAQNQRRVGRVHRRRTPRARPPRPHPRRLAAGARNNAVVVDSTNLTEDKVVARIERRARREARVPELIPSRLLTLARLRRPIRDNMRARNVRSPMLTICFLALMLGLQASGQAPAHPSSARPDAWQSVRRRERPFPVKARRPHR